MNTKMNNLDIVKVNKVSSNNTVTIDRSILQREVTINGVTYKLKSNQVLLYLYLLVADGFVDVVKLKELELNTTGINKIPLFEKRIVFIDKKPKHFYKALPLELTEDAIPVHLEKEIILTKQLDNNDKKVYLALCAEIRPNSAMIIKKSQIKLSSVISTGEKALSNTSFIASSLFKLRSLRLLEMLIGNGESRVILDPDFFAKVPKSEKIAIALGLSGGILNCDIELNAEDIPEKKKVKSTLNEEDLAFLLED